MAVMSVSPPNSSDIAAWAQACVSGVAILVSGAIAVFVPWNERRIARKRDEDARLDVECRHDAVGGLELLFIYRPQFHNASLSLSVTLVEPADAKLFKGEMTDLSSEIPDVRGKATDLAQRDVRRNAITLKRVRESDDYRGLMYVRYGDERSGPDSAKIIVHVLKHGNYLITESKLHITAQDSIYHVRDAPIAVIVGMPRDGWR